MTYTGITTLTLADGRDVAVAFQVIMGSPEPDVGIMTSYIDEVTIRSIDEKETFSTEDEELVLEMLDDVKVSEILRPQFEKEALEEQRALAADFMRDFERY